MLRFPSLAAITCSIFERRASKEAQPAVNAEVYRKEDTARCEDMFMHLQRGIGAGDPRSVDAGVRVLAHKAKLDGYTVEPEQVGGAGGFQVNIHLNTER